MQSYQSARHFLAMRFSNPIVTPRHAVLAARAALAAGVVVVAVATLSPALQGVEGAIGLSDKAAHFLAFFGLMAIALMAFPAVRRNDMAAGLIAFAAAVEVLQVFTGRTASLVDMAFNCAGVLAVVGPAMIERTREHARKTPHLSFAEIAATDVRAERGQRLAKGAASD
jgi:VanZ family protein